MLCDVSNASGGGGQAGNEDRRAARDGGGGTGPAQREGGPKDQQRYARKVRSERQRPSWRRDGARMAPRGVPVI
jgi:hypothetical protein